MRIARCILQTAAGGFDLIIGGDGGWSKTRRYLNSETVPSYAGVTRYWSTIPDAKGNAPSIYKFVNRGGVFSFSDGKAIMGQQMGDNSIDVAMIRVEPYDTSIETAAVQTVREDFGDWCADLLGVLESSQKTMIRKPLYELPVGYKWDHKAGVTLLGDAAHLMTPFAGEGVNLAFSDAMKLSAAILDTSDVNQLDKNIHLYEQDLFKRAAKAMGMTYGMKRDMFFTKGAPRTSIESWIIRRVTYDIPDIIYPILYPLIVAVVYSGYFVSKLFF